MNIYYRRTFQGALVLSAIANNRWVERQYMGYTKKQATQLFQQLLKENI